MTSIVDGFYTSDRHRQLSAISLGDDILSRFAYSLERDSTGVSLRPRIPLCKIKKKWRTTADEDGHYCFAVAL
jgi:hypothetical protein